MKKRDLIEAVSIHTNTDKKTATALVEGTIDVILATVASGEIVNISGFAKFAKIKRPARIARNPATGEQVHVKAKTVAKVTALKGFKDIALGVAPAPKINKVRPPAPKPAPKPVAKPVAKSSKASAKKTSAKKASPKKSAPKKAAPAKSAKKSSAKKAGGKKK